MKHVEYTHTFGMDEETVERRLRDAETGVLSLASGSDSYAIPVAHYYDDQLYFRLGVTRGSAKQAYLESTETACYIVYGTEKTADPRKIDSWSVHVTGSLSQLTGAERDRFDTAESNRHFAPIRVFDEDIEDIEISIVELEIETITGRTTGRG
ncbi:pyridoxamine 5'-phosphate oxidase family protein [Natronosalvus vescus]|uniref:pyridoxamine 5'-phosphate oxidase family protein n=1 Tax=Natronosalvus vescus TaxID=2953881 RepID=UPI00208FFC1F|nr:pyridoxamine 5'-phosphate oxidase family protein [Natronosalvus vescus]